MKQKILLVFAMVGAPLLGRAPTPEEIYNFLYEAGEINSTDPHMPNKELVTEYNKNTALIDAQNNNGETALMRAASRWAVGNVKFLLDKKASINEQDNEGSTALLYVVQSDKGFTEDASKVIEYLLENGAKPNIENHVGTPLIYAIINGNEDIALKIIRLLVDNGAKRDVIGTFGNRKLTAIQIAQQNNKPAIVEYLVQELAKEKFKNLEQAIKNDDVGKVQTLLSDPEIKQRINGQIEIKDLKTTLLIYATEIDAAADIIDALIKSGAEVNEINELGETALMIAAQRAMMHW